MAMDNLRDGCMLTEQDIVEVLKSGEDFRYCLEERARNVIAESVIRREDLIAGLMLSGRVPKEAVPSNRNLVTDRVEETSDEADRLIRERREWMKKELSDLCEEEKTVSRIWDGYYRLDSMGRTVLREYYLKCEPVPEIAGKLRISESTFWRKRKSSVRRILNFCREKA